MSINITLTPSEEQKLAELARAHGKDPAGHARDVVSAYLKGADQAASRTFEEIVSPLWEGWRNSGMTDSEVDDLFEQELHASRRERRVEKEEDPLIRPAATFSPKGGEGDESALRVSSMRTRFAQRL